MGLQWAEFTGSRRGLEVSEFKPGAAHGLGFTVKGLGLTVKGLGFTVKGHKFDLRTAPRLKRNARGPKNQ